MMTAEPQSRMKANVTAGMVILNENLKKNQSNKLSWFTHVHWCVALKTQNYIIKHYLVSFPNSGWPKFESVEICVCSTSS